MAFAAIQIEHDPRVEQTDFICFLYTIIAPRIRYGNLIYHAHLKDMGEGGEGGVLYGICSTVVLGDPAWPDMLSFLDSAVV